MRLAGEMKRKRYFLLISKPFHLASSQHGIPPPSPTLNENDHLDETYECHDYGDFHIVGKTDNLAYSFIYLLNDKNGRGE